MVAGAGAMSTMSPLTSLVLHAGCPLGVLASAVGKNT